MVFRHRCVHVVTLPSYTPGVATSGAKRPPLTVVHTSDLHVSDGDETVLATVAAVIDIALDEQAGLVILAGDTFDHDRVSAATADRVIAELARLHQPVVVIPGNHDAIDQTSIYRRVDLGQAGTHVHFVGDPDGAELIFDELAVAVWARGIADHSPQNRPLEGARPSDEKYWRIVIAHGLYVAAGEQSYRSSQIHHDEIAALDCDYLALGHIHRYSEIRAGRVLASYSGSASQDTDPGVNLVRFDESNDGTVWIERRPVRIGASR
jgi:DNA repair exonuclease SbcCD nuclease subunit